MTKQAKINNHALAREQNKTLRVLYEHSPYWYTATDRLCDIESYHILRALDHHKYNRTKAAKSLGIGVRTLQRKIAQITGKHCTKIDLTKVSDKKNR